MGEGFSPQIPLPLPSFVLPSTHYQTASPSFDCPTDNNDQGGGHHRSLWRGRRPLGSGQGGGNGTLRIS
jgi:hypothetical protein